MGRLGTIARRTFLFGAAALAGGAAFGYWYGSRPWDNPLTAGEGETVFNPWIRIAADNTITVIAPRAEMGQGIMTTLAALVAEELGATLDHIAVEHGPVSGAYYNTVIQEDAGPFAAIDESLVASGTRSFMNWAGKGLGLQATGGSSSTRDAYVRMREAGARARVMLIAAAASEWGVPEAEIAAMDATLAHAKSGRTATYGALAAKAAAMPVPTHVALKDPKDWTILGKPQKRVDLLPKVTGAPVYAIDVDLPDMVYATVRMSPRIGARAKSANLAKAKEARGVIAVVPIDAATGHGFGIIARSTWEAFRAAELIEAEWEGGPSLTDSAAIDAALDAALVSGSGWTLKDDGDVDTAFADAPPDLVVEAVYAAPFLAHAAMEPMNATARFAEGRLTLWTPCQNPTFTRFECARALGIDMDAVTINVTFLGGGFGRRLESDFSIYAALLAREAGGKPVKVTWTREEDFGHDTWRPAAKARMKARLDADGAPAAFDMAIAAPSIVRSFLSRLVPGMPIAGPDRLISEGAFDQPLAIPNHRVTGIDADVGGLPVGWWRSVGNSHNAFFHECALDEIAHAGKRDPVDLRLKLMAGHPAAVAVMEKVAGMSGWGTPGPDGSAKGVAFCLSFGAWVAEVVQVSGTPEKLKIDKVWIAADLGTVLDPGIVEAQLVSGAIYGLSAAMMQQVTFRDGRPEQTNFHEFDALRTNQCPQFEVALLQNAPRIGGAGEPGTPPAAPALANAIFALTGKRIRALPLSSAVRFA